MKKIAPMKNTRKVMASQITADKGYRSEREKKHNRVEREVKRNW